MSVGKSAGDFIENLSKGTLMNSNKAINSLTSGYRAIGNIMGGVAPEKAFNRAFREGGEKLPARAKEMLRHAGKEVPEDIAGKLNYGKMAGAYMGLSAGGRVVSGGGLTRDRNGKSDIIGVPFV